MEYLDGGKDFARNTRKISLHPGAERYYTPPESIFAQSYFIANRLLPISTLIGSIVGLIFGMKAWLKRRRWHPFMIQLLSLMQDMERESTSLKELFNIETRLYEIKREIIRVSLDSLVELEHSPAYIVVTDAIRRVKRFQDRFQQKNESYSE